MTHLEIAQKNVMVPVTEIAGKIGVQSNDLELYGQYKAKISFAKPYHDVLLPPQV